MHGEYNVKFYGCVSFPSKEQYANTVLEIKYQREWLQHVERKGTDRIPKQALK
jgi:hypothetical protein